MRVADFARFLLLRLKREWLYRFAPDKLEIVGECKQCGDCCRSLMLIESRGVVRSKRYFRKLQKRSPFYQNLEIIGTDDAGILIFSCKLLGEDGRCSRYEERPDICREFPNIFMFRHGGKLDDDCGYKVQEKVAFKDVLQKRMNAKRFQ